jgi:hypothetical protein
MYILMVNVSCLTTKLSINNNQIHLHKDSFFPAKDKTKHCTLSPPRKVQTAQLTDTT